MSDPNHIAKHLIARYGWRAPASKADTFEILSDEGVLPEGLSEAFQGAARFRNLVTYQTAIVENEIVYQILIQHLSDFETFLSSVAAWLGRQTD